MRLVRYCARDAGAGDAHIGVLDGENVVDAGRDLLAPVPNGTVVRSLGSVQLLAPVAAPEKIVCVGRNYAEHAAETGSDVPTAPQLFAKWANAIVGPGDEVVHPAITSALDYEAELVVVMGRRAQRVAARDALEFVYGYTCGNDISARDLQFGDTQWIRGKALDTFAPIGPCVVTRDEIPDPQTLSIRCVLNGETMQDANTSEMIFSVAEIIEFTTAAITLEPGDLIFTGTPPGVGFARTPPVLLRPGDSVRVEIERIGALENSIVAP
ncbi:MAG TPA: fumarylacetoacetate hydrolase family protein [Acidimicrobiia bacterium]